MKTEDEQIIVKAFWKHMQGEYNSKVIPKAEAADMKLVATFLDALGIQDDDVFMNRFTTTIKRRIYIPFEVGVANKYYDLWGQIVVCVHEHQHIEQGDRDGWLTFGGQYLTSSSHRANYEAEAYGCNLEMNAWRAGTTIDFDAMSDRYAKGLKNYGCSAEDIEQARKALTLRARVVAAGGVENRASQRAMAWLNEFAPELSVA